LQWVPLRDTSALAISFNFNHTNNDRGEAIIVRLIRATQFTTPFILTALHLVSNWWGVFEGVSRVSNILAVDILGKLIIYIALPLGVFLLRYRRGRASGLAHAASVAAEEKRSPGTTQRSNTMQGCDAGTATSTKVSRGAGSRSRVAPSPSRQDALALKVSPSDALSHGAGIFPPPPVSIPPSPPSPGAAGWSNVLVQRPAWGQEQMPLTQFKVVATKFNGKTIVPPQGAAGSWAALAGGTATPGAPSIIRSYHERGDMDYRARVAPSPSDLSLLQPLDAGSLLSQLGQLSVNLHSASGLKANDMNGKSDPYVVFKFSIFDQVILKEVRSGVKEKTVTPLWEESIVISERMSEELMLSGKLSLIVMDKDFGSMRDMLNSTDDKLGECVVALNVLDGNQSHEFKQALSPEGTIHFTVRFRPRVEASGVGETAWMDLEAATRLQRKFRQRKARRRMRAELAERKRRLLFFSWPIFAASMFDLVANTVVEHLIYWAQLEEMWHLYSILFIVPSIVICVRDLRLENRPRFSIAHGMFFIIVLYRVALKAALIDIFVEYYLTLAFTEIEAGVGHVAEVTSAWLHVADTSSGHFNMSNGHFNMSSDDFNSSSSSSSSGLYPVPKGKGTLVQTFVPLLTMIIHLSIFIMVTSFGKLSLELVATPNACAHLLFPFQFFDFVFLYSFFTLRSMDTPLTISWVLQQIVLQVSSPLLSIPPTSLTSLSSPQLILGPPFLLLQINIVLRNSGTTEVLVARCGLGNRIFNFLTGKKTKDKLKNFDPNQDPLIRLQYLARIGWQFDLADVCALLIVPTVVTVMIWRQGFYSLEGSTILVRRAGPSRTRPRPPCAHPFFPAIPALACSLALSLSLSSLRCVPASCAMCGRVSPCSSASSQLLRGLRAYGCVQRCEALS
jgi:hypothetical protein